MFKAFLESNLMLENWLQSRRGFLKSLVAAGLISQIPWLYSCDSSRSDSIVSDFSPEEEIDLNEVLMELFPEDGNGPSANTIQVLGFIRWTLADSQLQTDDRDFIINGLRWTNSISEKRYNSNFQKLDNKQRKIVISEVANTGWGEAWLSSLLTFVMEALLAHPVYGGNTEECGWKWLKISKGIPEPNPSLRYPEIIINIKATS